MTEELETTTIKAKDLREMYHSIQVKYPERDPCWVQVAKLGWWRTLDRISIMLDNHSFLSMKPDDDVEVQLHPNYGQGGQFCEYSKGIPDRRQYWNERMEKTLERLDKIWKELEEAEEDLKELEEIGKTLGGET